MKTYQILGIAVLVVLVLSLSTFAAIDGKKASSGFDEEVCGLIIKFRPDHKVSVANVSSPGTRTGLPEMDRLNAKWGVTTVRKLISTGQGCENHPFANYYVVEREGSADYAQMKRDYEQLSSVEEINFDFKVYLHEAPNDPLFPYQYNLHNTGQFHPAVVEIEGDNNDTLAWVSGVAGADINAYDAVSNPPDDSRTVIVAILDTGVDLDHPELAGRIWTNDHEIDGNGIDDDNNGYVDDVIGWDFGGDWLQGGPSPGDNDPSDDFGHGTHCAGIIASLTDNNQGIAGICPDVKIMAVRGGVMFQSYTIAAVIYAADNGADVISMSYGFGNRPEVKPLVHAYEYAHSKGIVLCASSGNSGEETIQYPACGEHVISVGATNHLDQVADFSTYSAYLDLVAPGVDILSLRADDLDMYARDPGVHIIDDYYYLASGTSMACPTVSGVAATLKVLSPGLDPIKTKELLTTTARDLVDPYGDGSYMPGWDMYSGWGCVDMGAALAEVPSVRANIASPIANEELNAPFVNITGTADGDDFQSYVLEYGEGFQPEDWFEIASSPSAVTDDVLGVWPIASLSGVYTVRLRVGEFNFDAVTVQLDPQTVPKVAGYNPDGSSGEVSFSNHPNPFNPTTEISFSLPHACHVNLEIFNIMGQRISTLVDRQMETGRHTVSFDGRTVASGVYLYRLKAGEFEGSKKMILVK